MASCRMNDQIYEHKPVLLEEATTSLVTLPGGVYIDATFGQGSHTRAILDRLNPQGQLIAFDKDPSAILHAKKYFSDTRFHIFHASFANLNTILTTLKLTGQVQGVLFDLGVSSPQLDNPERGFSFQKDGLLDMRMDNTQGMTAETWLQDVTEKELAEVLWLYGEEKASRKIARAIIETRKQLPIQTTKQLANIIEKICPRKNYADKHPATKSFQAIRIFINQELNELSIALEQAFNNLLPGGRLAVISFHSLEDRLVKQFIRKYTHIQLPPGLPIKSTFKPRLKYVSKPIKPGLNELQHNNRARSAILRIVEKLS